MSISAPRELLTAREEQVATEYSSGLSHRDVARKLGVSPSTVRTHIATVYRKLGVANKVELSGVLAPVAALAAEAPSRPGIAVLDFALPPEEGTPSALSGWIADGIASALSRFRSLHVTPRCGIPATGGGKNDWRAAAEATGARYLVAGRIVQAGAWIRVAAELIDGTSGALVWSRCYDRKPSDLFGFLDELSRRLASTIALEYEASELARVRDPVSEDPSAWELYCRALHLFWREMALSHDEVVRLCLLALEKDRAFAAPHILISRCHFYNVITARSADGETSTRKGIDHARQAIAMDSRDDAAFMLLGYNLGAARRFEDAEEAIARGLALNPHNSGLYNARAIVAAFSPFGDLARARSDGRTALRLGPNDPILWTCYATLGVIDLADEETGDTEAAVRNLQHAVMLPNADWPADFALAMGYSAIGRAKSAVRHLKRAREKLGHLNEADLSSCFGGVQARSAQFRHLAAHTLALS